MLERKIGEKGIFVVMENTYGLQVVHSSRGTGLQRLWYTGNYISVHRDRDREGVYGWGAFI